MSSGTAFAKRLAGVAPASEGLPLPWPLPLCAEVSGSPQQRALALSLQVTALPNSSMCNIAIRVPV